jgi:hypothetical protein
LPKSSELLKPANDFLESMRWPEGVECPKCQGKNVTRYQKNAGTRMRRNAKTGASEVKQVPARILYFCAPSKFSVTIGTIFNDTHLSLDKWHTAVALMVNAK